MISAFGVEHGEISKGAADDYATARFARQHSKDPMVSAAGRAGGKEMHSHYKIKALKQTVERLKKPPLRRLP